MKQLQRRFLPRDHIAVRNFLLQKGVLEADHRSFLSSSRNQEKVEFHPKFLILLSCAALLVADSACPDCQDFTEANVVPDLRILTRQISKSSAFAASVLSHVAEQRFALLAGNTIKARKEVKLSKGFFRPRFEMSNLSWPLAISCWYQLRA